MAIIASVLPAPDSLFDLLALHRLLLENGADRITLIVPYLGYARQDRPSVKGEAGIGIMVAELLGQLKASSLVLFDVHSERIRKAFAPSATKRPPCRSSPRHWPNGLPRSLSRRMRVPSRGRNDSPNS